MPGGSRYYPPRSWSTTLLVVMLVVLIVILVGAVLSQYRRSMPQGATANSNEVSQASPALVGKQVTIHGKLSLRCKVGGCIGLDNGQVVYLVPTGSFTWGKPYSEMEGKVVAATGTLRFYHEPPTEPTERAVQHVPDFFYFEVDSAQLRLASGD